LIATKGYSVPSVGKTITRARALAEQLGRSDYLVPLLYGQWAYYLVRAEHRLAMSIAQEIEKAGETHQDIAARLLSYSLRGLSHWSLGEFATAHTLFEQCEGISEAAHRARYPVLTGADQYPVMLSYFGATLMCLGYIDQGRAALKEAVSTSRGLRHAFTLAFALNWAGLVEQLAHLPNKALQYADETIALSNEHGFPTWLGV